jgi:hypothetical protein
MAVLGVPAGASALLLVGGLVFIAMKILLVVLFRRRVAKPPLDSILPVGEWKLIAAGYFFSSVLFIAAGALGSEPPWPWLGAFAAAAVAWTYFVVSRWAAGKGAAV